MEIKEKASRYDALQVAIGMYLENFRTEAEKEIPENIQGSLRYWELGRKNAMEQFVEVLGRWKG